jgi:hypothetical protein
MKKMELKKMELDELSLDELSVFGGHGIMYYLAYDVGVLLGSAAKVAEKIGESLYYGAATGLLK